MKLSVKAIERIREHIEAVEGTAEDEDDRQLARDLQTLLDIALNSKDIA
jgi:hypothetical protein